MTTSSWRYEDWFFLHGWRGPEELNILVYYSRGMTMFYEKLCRMTVLSTTLAVRVTKIGLAVRGRDGTGLRFFDPWPDPIRRLFIRWPDPTRSSSVVKHILSYSLKMFYQTKSACRPQRRSHFARDVSALPSPLGSDGMVPSAAAWRYLHRSRYSAFSTGR